MADLENKDGAKKKPPHRFKKGQSGNPGGRPKIIGPFRDACQKFIQEEGGWGRIVNFAMQDAEPRLALEALKLMVQYGIGKPPESVTFSPSLNIANLDVKGLDEVLLKAINGDVQLSKEQLSALRMALQKSGSLPDPFSKGFTIQYGENAADNNNKPQA